MATPAASSAPRDHHVGVIVPYDFAMDREIWRWVPPEVNLSVTRTARLPLLATVAMAELIGADATVRTAPATCSPSSPRSSSTSARRAASSGASRASGGCAR